MTVAEMTREREVGALLERAGRAIPATVSRHHVGCWLRYTDAPTSWWSGTVLMHGEPDGYTIDDAITAAEGFYAFYEAPMRFQVCAACPPELDDALSRRGYERGRVVSLQAARSDRVAAQGALSALEVTVESRLTRPWFDLLMDAQETPEDTDGEWRLFERIDLPSAYATARLDGRPVAVGRATEDNGWAGIFNMATLPEVRGRGAAGAILGGLATWARDRGNPDLYLQLSIQNTAAARAYKRIGFQHVSTYHYRVR